MGALIGSGGFGQVYRATFHGTVVAVKQLVIDQDSCVLFLSLLCHLLRNRDGDGPRQLRSLSVFVVSPFTEPRW
jgi:hypothetical protein